MQITNEANEKQIAHIIALRGSGVYKIDRAPDGGFALQFGFADSPRRRPIISRAYTSVTAALANPPTSAEIARGVDMLQTDEDRFERSRT